MVEKHKRDRHGRLQDGVRTDPVTVADRKAYTRAAQEVGNLSVPRMFDSSNPHSRFYIANFDGTGNDLWADPEHATNVGKLHLQLRVASARDPRVWPDYIEGAGTQDGVIARTIDGATGGSYDERIEEMYLQFIHRAKEWLKADPNADIRFMATGFSRGAEQAAGFLRKVHELGIQDEDGRRVVRHAFGPDTIEWTLPPLRAPGKTLAAGVFFDPVGTGVPNNHDRQPTSSMVSGIQITAGTERRNAFPSTQILRPGISADGRFVGITVPGAHSDIGGSYHRNGLAVLNFNIVADYVNALTDPPLVHRMLVPTDRSMFVIHHSEDHMPFYSTSEFRHDGQRDIMGSQASPPHCRERQIIACAQPDPLDPRLAALVGPRYLVGVHGPDAIHDLRDPTHPDHGMYRSASVQVLELYARSGFNLDLGQVDRLTAGLVIEAKRQGMTAIDDVQFGKDSRPDRPTLHAVEALGGNVDDPRSKAASIEALKALGVPLDASNQQLHALNQERDVNVGREREVSLSRDNVPAFEPSKPESVRQNPVVTPSRSDTVERADDDATRTLQTNLNTLGIRDMAGEPLATHGVYDVATQTAVARFQSGHALPVTGQADDATRNLIQGQAFIAELQQPGEVRMFQNSRASEVTTPAASVSEYARHSPVQANTSHPPMASTHVQPSRSDPRHSDSPDHALYNEIQCRVPDASEDRLVQFTAACHKSRITARNLSEVHLDEDKLTLTFRSEAPLATPARVDLSVPPPEPQQAIQQIQQFDQQMEQIVQQSQERSAQMGQGMAM